MLQQLRWIVLGGCFLLTITAPAAAQVKIGNEDATFRFGVLGQFWGDWNQPAGTDGYTQNLYIRRARLLVSGDIGKDITFFVQTDDPNLGKTPKALNAGFLIQDAFVEYKFVNAFRIDGGLMLVPLTRNALQSPASYYTVDISPVATVTNASTQSSALRDAGFAATGFFLDDRLQYRAGVFQGERDANAKNSLRSAAYVQYDFFEREKSYSFTGTALGKKKILAVDAGIDRQGSYRGYSANIAADIPVHDGDEIGGQFQYVKYDGRTKFPTILNQNDFVFEGAYYIHRLRVQPFGKIESQAFVPTASHVNDVNRYGGGVSYYLHGQNLKWTAQYVRAMLPNAVTSIKAGNEFTMQLQLFYF